MKAKRKRKSIRAQCGIPYDPSDPRVSFLQRIAYQPDILDKFQTAIERNQFVYHRGGALSERDLFGLLAHVESLAKMIAAHKDPKQSVQALACLGVFIHARILCRDHRFFAQLAAMLEHNSQPRLDKLSARICAFGMNENCGTAGQPCDPRKLLAYLQSHKHNFAETLDKLRKRCKKIGFVLTAAKPGRPRNNSHT